MFDDKLFATAVNKIRSAHRIVAFTGAGISVESGIPPFRGSNGLWSRYDPRYLDIDFFRAHPERSWPILKEIFYDHFAQARPNEAHNTLALLEEQGVLQAIITQNIDHLHHDAGSRAVIEFHGTSRQWVCMDCGFTTASSRTALEVLPPRCQQCGGIFKPDFVFFGEPIPVDAYHQAIEETILSDLWLVIGTTGEVVPACSLPLEAKRNGHTIIEINVQPSNFTVSISDIFLQGKAASVLKILTEAVLG